MPAGFLELFNCINIFKSSSVFRTVRMITYQEIYDLLRREKYNDAIESLPQNFLKEIAEYINEKKSIVNREQNLFSDTVKMTRKQLENSLSIIKEIIAIREKKVLNLAFTAALTGVTRRDTEHLFDYEKELFDTAVRQLEQNQQTVNRILEGIHEEKDLKNLFIRFKEDVPSFIGSGGNELGPFKRGDVSNINKEIAEMLINDSKAALIDEEI